MIARLIGFIPLLGDLFKSVFGWLAKREDTRINSSDNAKDVSVAIVNAESRRSHDAFEVYRIMLRHPVFWIAWGIGVLPVMTYHAMIFLVSTFPHAWFWLTSIPASQAVLKVPVDQVEFSKTVVGNVFLLTGASGLVAVLAQAWSKRV